MLKTQVEAGVLEDITESVKGYSDSLTPAARRRLHDQRQESTACPTALSQVGFFYNKELIAKARRRSRRDQDAGTTCLRRVKKLKAAGVTPIVVGGADKWPLHFYWTHLAVRVGGKPAFEAAMRGENGGFAGETFVKSGELFKQLVDLQPFQNGFLGFKNPQAVGYFGDGKARDDARHQHRLPYCRRALAADKVGSHRRQDRLVRLPDRPRRQGRRRPTRWAASTAGWSPRARRRRPSIS